jgi:hypothetical protein
VKKYVTVSFEFNIFSNVTAPIEALELGELIDAAARFGVSEILLASTYGKKTRLE